MNFYSVHMAFVAVLFGSVAGLASTLAIAQSDMDHSEHDQSAMAAMEMAAPVMVGDLELTQMFARATLPGAPVAGGFVTITNHGETDDVLVSASSDAAGELQLHNMSVVDDVMQMYEMEDGIPIPAGETVTLAPGGLHIMFMQLEGQLIEGETVAVDLTFEDAGVVTVDLAIKSIAAMNMSMNNHE